MTHKAKIAAPTEAEARTGAVRAAPVRLSAEDSIEMAAGRIFLAALDHFAANAAIFAQMESGESIHQMRVALRRLRAAIGLFRPALAGESLASAAKRAKTLAAALGEARDGDVFLELLAAGPGTTQDAPDLSILRAAAQRRRDAGYRAARETLKDAATTRFVEDVRRLIADRTWSVAPGADEARSARVFARDAISRLHKRVLRKSRKLPTQTPDERHATRIALKKLRYAAEFFESLFGRQRAARANIRLLAALQDRLGGFNDLATANRQIELLHASDDALALAAGFVRGWFAHAACASMGHAQESEKRLRGLKPFW